MKKCSKCKEDKSNGAFRTDLRYKSGLASQCRQCVSDRERKKRRADPDGHRDYMREYYRKRVASGRCYRCNRKPRPGMKTCGKCCKSNTATTARFRLRTYGLTREDFESILESQLGGCAICGHLFDGTRGPICIDHDHETGKVRGLLDRMCNQALGLFNDSAAYVRSALVYLEEIERWKKSIRI